LYEAALRDDQTDLKEGAAALEAATMPFDLRMINPLQWKEGWRLHRCELEEEERFECTACG